MSQPKARYIKISKSLVISLKRSRIYYGFPPFLRWLEATATHLAKRRQRPGRRVPVRQLCSNRILRKVCLLRLYKGRGKYHVSTVKSIGDNLSNRHLTSQVNVRSWSGPFGGQSTNRTCSSSPCWARWLRRIGRYCTHWVSSA